MTQELDALALSRARDQARALLATVRQAMVEVERPGRHALVALLADGHLLIEDVPGVGKTTLARIIARAIGGHDSRIQCTADLSPKDVIGRVIFSDNPQLRPDEFDPGPIFSNAVVMDEINRATPKLQSALFEAMEERYVSVHKQRHPLPKPFFVVATMNPWEEGESHRLPHGQRDRFAIKTAIGYPSADGELALLERFGRFDTNAEIDPIVAPGDVVKLQRCVSLVQISAEIREYIVRLVRDTRTHSDTIVGASPRAALSLQRCCQALALLEDTGEVTVDQVKDLFFASLGHRIEPRAGADAEEICVEVLESRIPPKRAGGGVPGADVAALGAAAVGAEDAEPADAEPADVEPIRPAAPVVPLAPGISGDQPHVSRLQQRYGG